MNVEGAVLRNLDIIKQYVKTTGSPDPGDLHLDVCQTDVSWQQGAVTAENLKVECPGIFKLTGTVSVAKDKTLSGELRLGITDAYLKWLPRAKKEIFTDNEKGYHTTTITLSGTMGAPHQDLSSRVMKEISKSPGTVVKMFFNFALGRLSEGRTSPKALSDACDCR